MRTALIAFALLLIPAAAQAKSHHRHHHAAAMRDPEWRPHAQRTEWKKDKSAADADTKRGTREVERERRTPEPRDPPELGRGVP